MRQLPADKYNVAWFKLAEFVVRGEKERALGLYRLLVHSFEDSAFACQLEGDLLLAFNDETAIAKYEEAAYTYVKTGRHVEAIALFENLLNLKPFTEEYLKKIITLYHQDKQSQKALDHAIHLAEKYIKTQRHEAVIDFMKNSSAYYQYSDLMILYLHIVAKYIQINPNETIPYTIADHIIETLLTGDDAHVIQKFLADIKERNITLYDYVCSHMKQS